MEDFAELDVEIALLPSTIQKRSGYRPNHKHPRTGEFFLGAFVFEDGYVDPGETARARLRILTRAGDLEPLLQFGSWSIWEGATHVAQARIIELISRDRSS